MRLIGIWLLVVILVVVEGGLFVWWDFGVLAHQFGSDVEVFSVLGGYGRMVRCCKWVFVSARCCGFGRCASAFGFVE